MSKPSSEQIDKALAALQAAVSGIRAALLVSNEGGMLGSSVGSAIERLQLSAASAASVAVARKAARDLSLANLERVTISCESGSVLLLALANRAILALVLNQGTSGDGVMAGGRSSIRQIEALL